MREGTVELSANEQTSTAIQLQPVGPERREVTHAPLSAPEAQAGTVNDAGTLEPWRSAAPSNTKIAAFSELGDQPARARPSAEPGLSVLEQQEPVQGSGLSSSTVFQDQRNTNRLSGSSESVGETQEVSAAEPPQPGPSEFKTQEITSEGIGTWGERSADREPAVRNALDALETALGKLGLPVQRQDGRTLKLNLRREVPFGFDSAKIPAESYPVLDAIADLLADRAEVHVTVIGHTDSLGSDGYNTMLSMRRAKAVAMYLVGRGGIADRVQSEGRGESEPVSTSRASGGYGKWLNRRIEILIEPRLKSPNQGAEAKSVTERAGREKRMGDLTALSGRQLALSGADPRRPLLADPPLLQLRG